MDFSLSTLMVWFENAIDWAIQNRSKFFGGIVGLVVLGCGVAVYRYMANQTKMAAHKELLQLVRMIEEPVRVSGEGSEELKSSLEMQKWNKVATAAEKSYQEFKSTSLGSTFLVFQADAFNSLGKKAEAIVAMRKAVDAMDVPAVRDCYQLKLALMQIDQADEAAKKEGVDLLKKISENQKHAAHDRALYYLGEYNWVNKRYAEAKNTWQQLVVKYGSEKGATELVEKAKERLELLAI